MGLLSSVVKGVTNVATLGHAGKIQSGIDHAGDILSGGPQKRKGEAAQKQADALLQQQLDQAKAALDFAKEQDANKQKLGGEWYANQVDLAKQEDERRFGLLPQIYDNAQMTMDEVMSNAGLTYDQLTGNAYDAQGQLVGNANDLYSHLTSGADQYSQDLLKNAQYSDADYQQAAGASASDVTQSFAKAREATRRNMLRAGINPNSSQFANQEIQSGNDQALAEANAINAERRKMKLESRANTQNALTAGYDARTNAEITGRNAKASATTAGAGMVGNAINAGRGAIDSATRYGRGAIDDALKTNLNTHSAQMGVGDPRLGLTSAALTQMNNNIETYGAQAGLYDNRGQQYNAQGQQILSDALGAVGMIGGAMLGGKPPVPSPGMGGGT